MEIRSGQPGFDWNTYMKVLYLACLATVLLSIFAFFQTQTIKQLRDQVSEGEQYSKVLSAGLDRSANERLELIRHIATLEEQLLAIANTPAITNVGSSNVDDLVPEEFDSELQEETSPDRYRTNVSSDGSVTVSLIIPPGPGPAWKLIEELRGTIQSLDEELNFAIESQDEEFRIVDLKAYGDFLDNINIDAATKQNILAQLVDANKEGFSRMLAGAVELQVNGLVAAYKYWEHNQEYGRPGQQLAPVDIMDGNLNQDQLQEFFDFEARRQSQRVDSTDDRIAELLGKLDLLP